MFESRWVFATLMVLTCLMTARAGMAQQEGKQAKVARMVTTLGYGGAIHNFKNYVLRGSQDHGAAATRMFKELKSTLETLREGQLPAAEKAAVDALEKTVEAYQAKLSVVGKLHDQGKAVEQIDEAVKIDDGPRD